MMAEFEFGEFGGGAEGPAMDVVEETNFGGVYEDEPVLQTESRWQEAGAVDDYYGTEMLGADEIASSAETDQLV